MAATGLDADGSIVGGIEFEAGEWTPMIATPSGSGSSVELYGWREVGSCGETTSAAPSDIAGDLVVGSTHGTPEAFVWSDVAGAVLLFEYECGAVLRSTTTGINTAGDVIGWSEELDLSYVRQAGGAPIGLDGAPGAQGAARSCAYGISDAGWIAGMSVTTNGDRAVRWSPSRVPEDLGPGIALDVNDSGMTVGYSWPDRSHAIVWTAGGTPLELGGPNGTAGDPTSWWDGSLDDAPPLPRFILRPGFLPC
jgi:uncharacterized membrane protein